MMKAILCLTFLNFSVPAIAATNAVFTPMKSVVVIQGEDLDANTLFEAMNMAEVDSPPNSVKKFLSFNQPSGFPYFDLSCTRDKNTHADAACIINIYKSKFARIDSSAKTISFAVSGDESWTITNGFTIPDTGDILRSNDKKLNIYVKDVRADHQEFKIVYQ